VHGFKGHPERTWSKKAPEKKRSKAVLDLEKNKAGLWKIWPFKRSASPGSLSRSIPHQAQLIPHAEGAEPAGDEGRPPEPPDQEPAAPTPTGVDSRLVCWPRDDLPNKVPNARIFTYGYDADVITPFQGTSKNTITDHGNDFLIALERDIPKDRPIIFLAHSLGGILVKDVSSISIAQYSGLDANLSIHARPSVFPSPASMLHSERFMSGRDV
jgi:hypothetical protein